MANVNAPVAKSEERIRTPKGIMIYPWVFAKDKLQDKYSMMLAVDSDDPQTVEFKKQVASFGKKAFNGDFPKGLSWCIRDGNEWMAAKNNPPTGKLAEAVKDKTLIVMKSDYAPTASHVQGGKLVVIEDEIDRKAIYAGAVGAAQGVLAAFDGKYPAIVFWFSQVAKLAAGEKIGGSDPNKTFGDMYDEDDDSVGAGAAVDDLDDEIPF